jgi:putative acetyltransferase
MVSDELSLWRERSDSHPESTRNHSVDIKIDDLTDSKIQQLLREHLADMARTSPPESIHALDLHGLRKPEVTFWSVWSKNELLGCGALKELNPQHGEIKSMRTAESYRHMGVASGLLNHILEEARRRNYKRVSLETGSTDFFLPARRLCGKLGFRDCGPFADYVEDPNSVFMRREL